MVAHVELALDSASRQSSCRRSRRRGRGPLRPACIGKEPLQLGCALIWRKRPAVLRLCHVMHSITVRRSCQPRPGPMGSPVSRSHTTTLARWLVMPTASIGDPNLAIAASRSIEHLAGHIRPRRTRRDQVRAKRADTADARTSQWRATHRPPQHAARSCRRR